MLIIVRTAVTATVLALAPSLSSAQETVARNLGEEEDLSALDRPARLTVFHRPLPDALTELTKRSGVNVAFSPSLVAEDNRRVSCECGALTVREALDSLLVTTVYRYTEVKGQILVFRRPDAGRSREFLRGDQRYRHLAVRWDTGNMLRLRPTSSTELLIPELIQVRTISGTVVDNLGNPIADAQVTVEGTSLGARTDASGQFEIRGVAVTEVTLRATYIGYRLVSQVVGVGATDVRIVLQRAAINLDEIVVTGTVGAMQKRAVGNSVTRIDVAEVLQDVAVPDVVRLINGRVPGVLITSNSGHAGGGAKVSIRGRNSLSLSTQPLVYVDGIRVDNEPFSGPNQQGARTGSRLNDIVPDDIESIEVIKGPAAATLYGTEASNGVIQIITRKGRARDRPEISFTVEQGTNSFRNPEGRLPTNFGFDASGNVIQFNVAQAETERGTPIWRTGRYQRYRMSVSGGSSTTRYFASAGLLSDDGVDRDNSLDSFSARMNLAFSPRETFDLNVSTGFITSKRNIQLEEGSSPIFDAIFGFPALKDTPNRGFLFAPHEVYVAVNDIFQDLTHVTTSVQANHRVGSWFSHRLTAGVDLVSENNQSITQRMTPEQAQFFSPTQALGQKALSIRDVTTTTIDYNATVSANLSPALASKSTVGGQYYRKFLQLTFASGREFPAPGLQTIGATAVRTGSDDFIENVTAGVFFQQQFSWRDRLFLIGAVRADDNSAFGENFDLVAYPKFSAAWVMSDEPFWGIDFVDAFRVRAAFGATGQQPDAFAALRTLQPIVGPDNRAALTPQAIGNPDLKPERGEEFEAGFEASMFSDRLSLDFTYFRQTRRDAILGRPIPVSSGFQGTQFVNIGKIRNRGTELQVNGIIIDGPKLGWELTLSASTNSNEILDLGGLPPTVVGTFPRAQRHQEGFPVAGFFGQRIVSAELDAGGQAVNLMCDGGPENGGAAVPCAEAPDIFLGQSTPRYEGAVGSTVTLFRRLRLYALLDFKLDYKRFDVNDWARCTVIRLCEENVSPENFAPERIGYVQQGSQLRLVDGFINDAAFAKLRELSASLDLPGSWMRFVGGTRGSITVTGRNLATWTDWTGLDPESEVPGTFGELSVSEQATMPQPVQFRVTMRLTF